MTDSAQLAKLLISEVSGVDDPANEIPGWLVAKSTGAADGLMLGFAMELMTKAADSKEPYGNVEYADPGLQEDGKKRYPLDTDAHVRAAWSYINQEDNAKLYSAEDLGKVKSKIQAAMKKLGAETETKKSESTDPPAIVAALKKWLAAPTEEEDVDMTSEELTKALDERDEALAEKLVERLSKSVEAPAPAAAEPTAEEIAAEAEVAKAALAEQISTAVEAGIEAACEPLVKALDATLDRLAKIEDRFVTRKSIESQEGEPVVEGDPAEKSLTPVQKAIANAFGA